jgi:hypothetical protein
MAMVRGAPAALVVAGGTVMLRFRPQRMLLSASLAPAGTLAP